MQMSKYMYKKQDIYSNVILLFLPNLQCKKYKSENKLKSNKRIIKPVIKSNVKMFPIYN